MDGPEALKLLKEVGVYRLCGTDGCLCMSCKVQGVTIDVTCRKSNGYGWVRKVMPEFRGTLVRVYSRHLDKCGDDLAAIAKEIAAQISEDTSSATARFCDHRHDDEQLCTYCDKPREDLRGYLCDACLAADGTFGGKVADQYDLRRFDFTVVSAD